MCYLVITTASKHVYLYICTQKYDTGFLYIGGLLLRNLEA
jgi:hypothetical protein